MKKFTSMGIVIDIGYAGSKRCGGARARARAQLGAHGSARTSLETSPCWTSTSSVAVASEKEEPYSLKMRDCGRGGGRRVTRWRARGARGGAHRRGP